MRQNMNQNQNQRNDIKSKMKYSIVSSQLLFSIGIMLILLFTGCAKDEEKVEPTFSSLWDNVFFGCGSCHSGSDTEGLQNGPDLSSKAGFYTNLLGKNATDDYPFWVLASGCYSFPLIEAGNPNNSIVAAALIKSVSLNLINTGGCDTAYSVHETNGSAITNSDTAAALIKWIEDGAKND